MKAIYHQSGRPDLEMEVKAQDKAAKTADLAIGDAIKIEGCPVSDTGALGTCTLVEPAKAQKQSTHHTKN